MAESTFRLIERLAAEARPVRRLRAPLVRAAGWLLAAGMLAGPAVYLYGDPAAMARPLGDPFLMLEAVGALLTGVIAVIAAFQLSLPDRRTSWALLPVPPLLLWLAHSGYGCYQDWMSPGAAGWALGDSTKCFAFILSVSVPLGISLLMVLRRSCPLAPGRVAAVAGLGVAALAAFLLQFFHPFDVTFMDLAVHLVAVGIVVGVSSWAGRAGRLAAA